MSLALIVAVAWIVAVVVIVLVIAFFGGIGLAWAAHDLHEWRAESRAQRDVKEILREWR